MFPRCVWFLAILAFGAGTLRSAPAPSWTKLEGCTLIADAYRDGDSFHVRAKGRDYIFRLYFVDTPEDDNRFPERIAEQAGYFGVTPARSFALGLAAAEYSRRVLGAAPFTVWTLWRDARGASSQPRFYAYVATGQGSLASLLVANGLARIYGVRVTLPDGMDSRAYLAQLAALEAEARAAHRGGWGGEPSGGDTVVAGLKNPENGGEAPAATDDIPAF